MFKPTVQKASVKSLAITTAPDNQQGFARFAHLNFLAKEVAKHVNDVKHYEVPISGSNIYIDVASDRGILDFEFEGEFDGSTDDLFNIFLGTYLHTGDYNPQPDEYYIQATVYSNGTVIPVTWVAGYAEAAHLKIKNLNPAENNWGSRFYLYYELVKIK